MRKFTLDDFVVESNRIEQIDGASFADMDAHELFLATPVSVDSLGVFVEIVAGAELRDKPGMDVRVGNHVPQSGGSGVRIRLEYFLGLIGTETPYQIHQLYEGLHPFIDGNGRSGRALWLHMMGGIEQAPLGFLHHWYYQSLDATR